MSNDQGLSIDQNNDNISLSTIDEDTSIIYKDMDEDISKYTEINNEDEKLQDNKFRIENYSYHGGGTKAVK